MLTDAIQKYFDLLVRPKRQTSSTTFRLRVWRVWAYVIIFCDATDSERQRLGGRMDHTLAAFSMGHNLGLVVVSKSAVSTSVHSLRG